MSHVRYAEARIDPDLTPFIRLIWALEVDGAADAVPERIVPDGIVEAVFHYRCPYEMRYDGEAFAPQPTACVVSQTRRFIEIRPRGPGGFISVRFHPWGAHHFVGVPLTELTDRSTPAEVLWGPEIWRVVEGLSRAPSDRARAAIVQRFLRRKLERHGGDSVHGLVQAVWLRRGVPRISSICRDLGVTERQLERRFTTTLGIGPKHLARLARFLTACQIVRQGRHRSLAAVAQQAGYYDQSHCAAEFQEFAGMTPTAFAAAQRVFFLDVE